MARPPLNYTTKVPVSKTLGECQRLLGEGGASAVGVMYEDRKPVGLSFDLKTPHGVRSFLMPVNIDGVASLLRNADYPPNVTASVLGRYTTREHAERVAWRVVKDWLEAQLALIDAQMVRFEQVMLPYLEVGRGVTLWDRYLVNEQRALEAGGSGG